MHQNILGAANFKNKLNRKDSDETVQKVHSNAMYSEHETSLMKTCQLILLNNNKNINL